MNWLPGRDYFRDNVVFRNDTLLGVCEALGCDLGFNPNFLRIPLAAGIIIAPLLMLGTYAALGVLAFVSRTFFPDRVESRARLDAEAGTTADNSEVELPRAA
jgi:phage shock protein C